jgi:hypothetical protein
MYIPQQLHIDYFFFRLFQLFVVVVDDLWLNTRMTFIYLIHNGHNRINTFYIRLYAIVVVCCSVAFVL